MSSASSLSLCWTLSLCLLVSVSAVTIRAKPGEDVSLPCRAPRDKAIVIVEWTRPELKPEYVLFYRDGKSEQENQHPSFEGRVELKDGEMKDGDVTLILKNVNSDDTGTYECRTGDPEPLSTVSLEVQPGGEWSNAKIGLVVAGGLLVVAGVSVGVYKLYEYLKGNTDQSSYKALPDDRTQ